MNRLLIFFGIPFRNCTCTNNRMISWSCFFFEMRMLINCKIFLFNLSSHSLENVDGLRAGGGYGGLCAVWPGGSTETSRRTKHTEYQGLHQLPTLRTDLEGVQETTRYWTVFIGSSCGSKGRDSNLWRVLKS